MAKPLPILIGVLGLGATATGGYMLVKKGNGGGTGTSAAGDSDKPNSTTSTVTDGATVQPPTVGGDSQRLAGGAAGQGDAQGGSRTSQPQGGAAGGNHQSQNQISGASTAASKDLLFDGITTFKKNAPSQSDCLKDDFTGLSLENAGGDGFGDNKPEKDKFFKTNGDPAPATKSCLIINWKKSKDESTKKWNGKFTWLWTFQRGEEGFVTFNVMEPGSESGKVKFTGVFYLVEKADSADTWSVKYKKEAETTSTEVDSTTLDDYFPKSGEDIKKTATNLGDYWGLIDAKEKLGELCKGEDDCNKVEVKELQWTAAAAGADESKTLKDWSVDLKWWESIYKEVKDKWNFGDKIASFKGKWTLKTPQAQ